MRWTLLLALGLLALPSLSQATVIPTQHTQDGHFFLAAGMSRTYTMTVYKQEPNAPVTLDLVFERVGYASGFHVTSPVCQDPNVGGLSVVRTTTMATVRCGYLPPGRYPFAISLDFGVVQGSFQSTTAHLR